MIRRKIRPEGFRRPDFCISNLPQQEVADTQISAGTDQKVRRRQTLRIQMILYNLIIYILYGQLPCCSLRCNRAHCVQNFCLPAVVYSQIQNNTGVALGRLNRMIHLLLNNLRQTFTRADKAHLYIVFVKFINLIRQIAAQKLHNEADLRHRTLPVFRRKGIGTDNLYTQLISCSDNSFQSFGTGLMAKGTHLSLSLRPTTIAIHNNSNMLRNIIHIQTCSIHHHWIFCLTFCLK